MGPLRAGGSGRGRGAPQRSASAPATGATAIGVAVHGSSRMPASSGEVPERGLQELRHQEERSEEPGVHEEADRVRRAEAAGGGRARAAASGSAPAAPR